MSFSEIISLLSGIALFLFGMSLMSDVLNRISGNELEPKLYKLSGKPLKGLLLGTGVTAVIQSSSATSVIVIGFVNSGIMKLKQAIPVILGAIFGTSITGWLICLSYIEGSGGISEIFSTATITGVAAIIGILLRMTGKSKKYNHIGDIFLGLAILMFGMSLMSSAVVGLKDEIWFNDMLTSMSSPFFGILTGILISALLQSASAAVGVVQALSVTGAITFSSALPLFMGISIGAALPVLIASIGTGTNGKRTALSYLVACVIGVAVFACVFYTLDAIFHFNIMTQIMNPFSLALANTVFRLLMVCILFPLSDIIETLVTKIIPDKQKTKSDTVVLDDKFTDVPAIAIEQSRAAMRDMAKRTEEAVRISRTLFTNYTKEAYKRVCDLETDCDNYEDRIGSFLMKVSGHEMTEMQTRETSIFLHALSDIERISDHAAKVATCAKELYEKGLKFSDEANRELSVMGSALNEIIGITIHAFCTEDAEEAERIEPIEEVIDNLYDRMKRHHVERLRERSCGVVQSFIFNDLITAYERMADHCSNIAVALIEIYSGTYAVHEYLGQVKTRRTDHFEKYYDEYSARFSFGTHTVQEAKT